MKYLSIVLGIIFLFHFKLYSQDTKTISYESLKLNSSPAFILLGVEPENIQRPGTPTAFVTGLQNVVSNNKLQPNLAFELSPYYMAKKTGESDKSRFDASNFLLDQPNIWNTIARTASVSLGTSATSEETFGDLQKGTGLGLGLRFQIISGRASKAYRDFNYVWVKKEAIRYLKIRVEEFRGTFDITYVLEESIKSFLEERLPAMKNSPLSKNEIEMLTKDLKALVYDVKAKGSTQQIAKDFFINKLEANRLLVKENNEILNKGKTPLAKQGFMLEFAAGQAYVFENDSFNSGRHAKSAIWLTPSYRTSVEQSDSKMALFDIMGVGRYIFNNQNAGVDQSNYLDVGTKLAFTRDKWSVNGEFVYRYATNLPDGFTKNYTYRLVTGADYKITDAITVKFNFGTNFDGNSTSYTDPKKIFAIGGIELGLLSFDSK